MDLEQQKIISPVGEFTFEIDSEWKHKLLNGLDDIGITLQYEDLIATYENNDQPTGRIRRNRKGNIEL